MVRIRLSMHQSSRALHVANALVALSFLAVAACNGQGVSQDTLDLTACASSDQQAASAGAQVIEQRCNGCHSFDPGNLGSGALGRIQNGSMPPGGGLTATELAEVNTLVSCASSSGGATQGGGEDGEDEGAEDGVE